MNLPTSLALVAAVILTASFIDPAEPLRCLSASCISANATIQDHCQLFKKEHVLVMDGCVSCGESFTQGPLGKLVVLRTCELDLCMNGKDGLVHLKGPKTFAAIRCCHEDFCNNGTMPAIPFHEDLPIIEGVEDLEKHDPSGGHH